MGQTSVTAAVITASVAVVLAVVAQLSTWALEHRNRVYERRRAALLDLQDAALAVRVALRRLNAALRTNATEVPVGSEVDLPDDPRATAAHVDAEALLALHLARVESPAVVTAALSWHEAARSSFLGGADVSAAETQAAWVRLNKLIGEELTVPGWWRRRRR